MEILRELATALCRNCSTPTDPQVISLTVGEWSPERWHHVENGLPTCPGSPVAQPIPHTVVPLEERT